MRELDISIDSDGDLVISREWDGETIWVQNVEDAYALLHELVEFIKMKETINEEQS